MFNPYWYSSAFNLGSLQGLLSARRDWPKWYSLDVSLNRVRTGYNPSSLLIEKDPYIIINPMDWDEEGRTNIEDQKSIIYILIYIYIYVYINIYIYYIIYINIYRRIAGQSSSRNNEGRGACTTEQSKCSLVLLTTN